MGYLPERFPKQVRFTPLEYLNYMGKISGIPVEILEPKLQHLIDRFSLKPFSDQRINELSKGNIQKVGLIQALLGKQIY